jgi:hypothetical protein
MRRLAALAVAVMVCGGLAGCSNGTAVRTTGPVSGLIRSSTHRFHIAQVSIQTTCQSTQLRAHATSGGGEASQPFVAIAVTNRGPSCAIGGYPLIVGAWGHTLSGAERELPISVVDGSEYERHDPAPHRLILKQGSAVSFDLGTNTATGSVYVISELKVMLPGESSPLLVSVHTGGSALIGSPIRLLVTAFVTGSAGSSAG